MIKLVKTVSITVLIVACLATLSCSTSVEAVIRSVTIDTVSEIIESREIMDDPGIHLILAGTGAVRIDAEKGHPCTAIIANGEFLVFDAGPNCVGLLYLQGYPIAEITRVFLTHMHSDHTGGVGNLINFSYINGRRNVLDIFGPDDSYKLSHSLYPPTSIEYRAGQQDTTNGIPDRRMISELTPADLRNGIAQPADSSRIYIPGVGAMVDGINQAYRSDMVIRTGNKQIAMGANDFDSGFAVAHPIPDMPDTSVADRGWGELLTVFTSPDRGHGRLIVKAFLVDHYPCFPSYGYRIEYAGRTIVISGDTESLLPYEGEGEPSYWIKYAENADVLVHDALNTRLNEVALDAAKQEFPQLAEQIEQLRGAAKHHTGTIDVAKIAHEAGVKKLVLTHIPVPTPNRLLSNYFIAGMSDYFTGEIVIGEDGTDIYLPVAGTGDTTE